MTKRCSKEAEITRTAKVIGNALDAEIQIILLENVRNHRRKITKEHSSETLGVIAVRKMMKKLKTKHVSLLTDLARIENEKLKEEALKLAQFQKSTRSLNEMFSTKKPSGDKSGLGFNSFEASSSGTKEIKFVKSQNKTSSGGGPQSTVGGPHKAQTAPKEIKEPPVFASDNEVKRHRNQKEMLVDKIDLMDFGNLEQLPTSKLHAIGIVSSIITSQSNATTARDV
ncbi:hypothetical protein Tco_0537293 [Tanacetum coccineum]